MNFLLQHRKITFINFIIKIYFTHRECVTLVIFLLDLVFITETISNSIPISNILFDFFGLMTFNVCQYRFPQNWEHAVKYTQEHIYRSC